MFVFCPACASRNIRFAGNRFDCPDCGFVYYHNTAAATGCVVDDGSGILFLMRGREPATGKLDLPGGFVDPGEGCLEALMRECREEIGWEPPADALRFFASFPNIYPYRGISYQTCDLFFYVRARGLQTCDLRLEREEVASLSFVPYDSIDFDVLAFDSARKAVERYLGVILPTLPAI